MLAPKVVTVPCRRSRSFSRNGTPLNGPSGRPCDLLLGVVIVLDDDRIDLRVHLCGAGDRLIQQFLRTYLLLADEIGEADCVILAVFLEGHAHPLQ